MFDLDRRIGSWRQTLPPALADRPEVVDELEGHLRDDVERLVRSGAEAEQAWDAALARLGDPHKLAEEFAKAPAQAWLPARLSVGLLGACAVLLAALLAARLYHARVGLLLAGHVFAITTGYVAALAVGVCAMAGIVERARGHFGARQSQAFRRTGARLAAVAVVLTVVGVALGAVWSRGHFGRAWAWDPREVGGLGVLAWSCVLLSCLRRPAVATTATLLAGVIGNVVVALSWFAPPLIENRGSAGLASWHAPLLGAFVFTQLAWLYAGLLPPGWLSSRPVRGGGAV